MLYINQRAVKIKFPKRNKCTRCRNVQFRV